MADSTTLPGLRAPLVNSGGVVSPEWWRFFRDLQSSIQAAADSGEIDLSGFLSSDTTITGNQSVQTVGALSGGNVTLRLVADVSAPGNTYFYGTDAAGAKGWQTLAAGFLAGTNITLTTGLDGVTTIDATGGGSSGYNRITAAGDIRATADGNLRITN